MDEDAGAALRDPVIAVTGLAHEVTTPGAAGCDPSVFLKVRKSRKFMGVQDDLAVVCAGRALAAAGLAAPLGERVGLYLSVGYIPFQEADIGPVLDASTEDGRFSMRRFAEGGYQRAHPLLTFKCLPNMPAYHVSVNFDLQGPYVVTYPGAGQLYTALEEAIAALREGTIDVALVGGVAHQRNFLVEHHFRRIEPPVPAARLRDAGAMMVLESEEHARGRGAAALGRLAAFSVGYGVEPSPAAALESAATLSNDGFAARSVRLAGEDAPAEYGAASLPLALSMALEAPEPAAEIHHRLADRNGIRGESRWRLAAHAGGTW